MNPSISIVTRSLNTKTADIAFSNVRPDLVRTVRVRPNQYERLIASDPVTAGNQFHALLGRMADYGPLSTTEKAYLPWMDTLRTIIWSLGAYQMDMEYDLRGIGAIPSGICDLHVHGGPQKKGVVEVKVVTSGSVSSPRGRDLAQTGAYARLIAGKNSFDNVWAAVAYVEIETRRVRFVGFRNARNLVSSTIDLLRVA